ncbi:erythromycin esterase family protein [Hyalangium gracile]|uniref:erythromycin esterase family protein n=1 Tax=Hyalangium gracile TaxID=394092 RepID=UPI001CC99D98|nr:erythromycin esterase family protein [Hyalangium gracile]
MRRIIPSCLLLALWLGCATGAPAPAVSPGPAAAPTPVTAPSEAKPRHVLSGKVLGPGGEPIAGARVGLTPRAPAWDLRQDAPRTIVETGADGSFQAGPLESLAYSVGVYAPSGAVAFGPAVTREREEQVPPVELRLSSSPATLEGAVWDEAGTPVPGAEVRIARLAIPYDDVAYLPPSPDGRYRVTLTPGQYAVIARVKGYLPSSKVVTVEATGLTLNLRLEQSPDAAQRQAAIAWVKQKALPLRAVEAGNGFEDLQPLKKVLQDVQVVALGEATHGTREFFQLKHRMLEFLATELGYTLFAIESDVADAHAVNTYVLTGQGDAAQVLAGLGFWNNEEVLELIRWMRRYNEDPSHTRKLTFHGVDMQGSVKAVETVAEYLLKVDAPFASRVKERLAPLADKKQWFRTLQTLSAEDKKSLAGFVDEVLARFDARKQEYVRGSDARQWARMRHTASVLRQLMERHVSGNREVRDRSMAENLRWAMEYEGPETKAVVWAHNGHVTRTQDDGMEWPMGRHLARELGRKLYVFGFAFHQGGFQAWNISRSPAEGRRGMVDFFVPPAPEDTLDAMLGASGLSLAALDLRTVPRGPVYEWWRHTHRTRSLGFVYSDEGYPLNLVRPLEAYDGLLFVERTTPARPLPQP